MARVSTYVLDTTLSANDYLLGNDGDSPIATKRFSLPDLRTYFLTGTGTDILTTVPKSFIPTVNQAGTAVERSPLSITHTQITGAVNLIVDGSVTTAVARYAINNNGQATIAFENFNEPYYLPSLIGKAISFTTTLSPTVTRTGTIASYVGVTLNTDGDYIDTFNITMSPSLLEGTSVIRSLTVTNATQLSISLGIVSADSLTVSGATALQGAVEIGTETETSPTNLTVHGFVDITAGADGGIRFGSPDPDSSLTTNADGDLTLEGGSLLVQNQATFEMPIIVDTDPGTPDTRVTISDTGITVLGPDGMTSTTINSGGLAQTNSDGGSLASPSIVTANNIDDTTIAQTQQLASIQVGSGNFVLPELSAGVATALPGFNEMLGGHSETSPVTIGRLFYGIEQSSGAMFQSAVVSSLSSVTIASGTTSVDLGDDIDTNVTTFEAINTAKPDGQSIFFVESTYLDAFPSAGTVIADTETRIYEVISYTDLTNVVTFGLLGQGTINISTSTLQIQSESVNLPNIPSGSTTNFVYYDPADGGLSQSSLAISGRANGATYDIPSGTQDVPVASIDYQNFNCTIPADGAVVIRQGHEFGGVLNDTNTVTTASVQRLYVLDTITSAGSIALPSTNLVAGDSIKFSNVSTHGTNDATVTSSTWSITGGGNNIIKSNTALVLDDQTASFELIWTGDTTVGWIIIGIN